MERAISAMRENEGTRFSGLRMSICEPIAGIARRLYLRAFKRRRQPLSRDKCYTEV